MHSFNQMYGTCGIPGSSACVTISGPFGVGQYGQNYPSQFIQPGSQLMHPGLLALSHPYYAYQLANIVPLLGQESLSGLQGIQSGQIAKDIIHDGFRRLRNLGLANDLIDVRNADKMMTHGINPIDMAIDAKIKSFIRDAKYDRNCYGVVFDMVSGRPHLPDTQSQAAHMQQVQYDWADRQCVDALVATKLQSPIQLSVQQISSSILAGTPFQPIPGRVFPGQFNPGMI